MSEEPEPCLTSSIRTACRDIREKGPIMRNPVLSEPDRRAVDLLLNHACGVSGSGHCDPVPHQRIEAVRRLLANLDKMPPVEPPPGLVRQTMDRIDRAMGMTIGEQANSESATLH
jgi:hypothetical protein